MNEKGEDVSEVKGVISILSHTANLVELFNDKLVISSASGPRLGELDQFYRFITDWREKSLNNNTQFVSTKLWFDLQSMCLGFNGGNKVDPISQLGH